MYEVEANNFISYDAYKQEVGIEITNAQNSMVRIGYLLKVARDTDVLSTSGYDNYIDFAQGEFGLDKSTVSRFININDKFSEGGNSDHLISSYEGYGRAKLQEMLLIPDYINEELSPALTKSEIQTIKQEVVEEEKVTDIEVMLEPDQKTESDNITRFMYEILKNDFVLYKSLWDWCEDHITLPDGEEMQNFVMSKLLTEEEKYYLARPAGLGKMMLTLRESGKNMLTSVRSGETEEITAYDLARAVLVYLPMSETVEEAFYNEFGIEITKVAPVQQTKESKVTVSKPIEEVKEAEKPINTSAEETYPQADEINVDNSKEAQKAAGDNQKAEFDENLQKAEEKSENITLSEENAAEIGINPPSEDENAAISQQEGTDIQKSEDNLQKNEAEELPFPEDKPIEVVKTITYVEELKGLTNPELKKEAINSTDQIRIAIYRFESWKDDAWFSQARAEYEHLGHALDEIERRKENGTWRG